MATRQLKMRWEPIVCYVCQRSLLRGEFPVSYYDGDQVRSVCELCTTRAHRNGWVREGTAVAQLAPAAHAERARSLVARLRGRREPPPPTRERARAEASTANAPADDLPHHVHALPAAAEAQVARALSLFNASEHARTIGGVVRSLGAPYVYAGAEDLQVDLIVLWELCWYRYEVDLENAAVRLRGQGYEAGELGSELPPANALVDEHGNLSLASV